MSESGDWFLHPFHPSFGLILTGRADARQLAADSLRCPQPHASGPHRLGNDRRRQPIVVQSMCATKTADLEATVAQVNALAEAGAGVVRIAADTPGDAASLAEIRRRSRANLSVDLQENYRLAADVAPWVDKIRYNPGHLYHHDRQRPWQDKVRFLVDTAGAHDCALRVGVNCGSVDPAQREQVCRRRRPPADASQRPGPLRVAGPAGVYAAIACR